MSIRRLIHTSSSILKSFGKTKIFCIGRNKTGTTSIGKALADIGFALGDQIVAEMLLKSWAKRDFKPIMRYCHTAQAFQDIPFSLPYTFQALDMHFPNSKFILTIRNSPEEWYDSLVRFHTKIFGPEAMSSLSSLKEVSYRYKGFIYEAKVSIYGVPEDDPYNKEILINHYNNHNDTVLDYFSSRPEDLLVLNLADKNAYKEFCNFLSVPCTKDAFPWVNKT